MEAWNQAWNTAEGREAWLTPERFVIEMTPHLHAANARRVLDLGFGVGRHAILLAKEGFDVYGIDASENGKNFATEWAEREGVTLKLSTGDMAQLPFEDNFFDAVLSWNVVYHGLSAEIEQTRNEILRCLKPHGHLLLTLISTQHKRCGIGNEVEPHTYVIPGEGETSHPHRYFDRDAVEAYLDGLTVLHCEDVEQSGPDTYHWQILARYDTKSAVRQR